ncbi:hypothetical protein F9K33_01545 [bacterium]|nr:MAG: hypothetical protein F9K33_01545 [bacterium]
MSNIDYYCYYKIDLEKLEIFNVLAKKITELYSNHSGCLSYRFSLGLDPDKKNTAMESGQFSDIKTFHEIKENIETQNPEIFGALDAAIPGGLKARKYEFFTSLA